MATDFVEFPCLCVKQPIGEFYIGVIGAADLVEISYADVRRIEGEKRDVETYLGIQRPLNKDRVKELRQYVQMIDASFPTGIIVAVSHNDAKFNKSSGTMRLPKDQSVAKILDGQHRIAGLQDIKDNDTFQLNIVIFVDMDIQDQAMVFATINLSQTKMNRSLAYDLYELMRSPSPQKTCHEIARLLNRKEGSPFRKKIKILGTATEEGQETLSQAAFFDRLIEHVCEDRQQQMTDRDQLRRGRKLPKLVGPEQRNLIFRNLFIERKDAEIAKTVWNYFSAVQNRWGEAWSEKRDGHVLNRTTGFNALMRFLRLAVLKVDGLGRVVGESEFDAIFKKMPHKRDDFTPDNYKPGSAGQGRLFEEFKAATDPTGKLL